jgi:hypothetical protein
MAKRLLLVKLLLLSVIIYSQTNSYSPYSVFGIGDFAQNHSGSNAAMGGVFAGMQNGKLINYYNPASYIDADSNDFVVDFALSYFQTDIEDSKSSISNQNMNFEHFAIKFPFTKFWSNSIGIIPLSKVKYEMEGKVNVDGTTSTTEIPQYIYGDGGLNQFYWGHAFKYNNLSLGFNVFYIWGDVEQRNIVDNATGWDLNISQRYTVDDFRFSFGSQYKQDLSQNSFIIYGLSYETESKINTKLHDQIFQGQYTEASQRFANAPKAEQEIISNKEIVLPQKLNLGVSYAPNQNWLLAGDYSFMDKGNYDVLRLNKGYKAKATHSLRLGAEFTPETYSKNYFDLVNYRAGFNYTQSPYEIAGENIDQYTFSLGFGLPFPDSFRRISIVHETKSMANLSFEYGKRGTTSNGLLQETYYGVKLNITLNARWFFKRKYY